MIGHPLSWLVGGHLLSVLTFPLAMIFFAILLRSRRTPASTIAWMVAVALVPYVGIPLYLLLGSRKFGSRAAGGGKGALYGRGVASTSAGGAHRGSRASRSFQRILESAGAPPPSVNSRIEFLGTGDAAYARLIEMIRGARERIDVTTYIFSGDRVGSAILAELTARAAAGVEVRLIIDAVGSILTRRPSFREYLRAGGKLAWFMPLIHSPFHGRTNLRSHRKLVVCDGRSALIGGMNFAEEYLGPDPKPDRWQDLSVYLEGGTVVELHEIFRQDWAFAAAEPPQAVSGVDPAGAGPAAEGVPGASGELEAQAVASGPDVPGDPLYDAFLLAVFEARRRIWIATPYFVPDESLAKGLELAGRRGVDVRLLIPRRSNHRFADLCRGSYVRQIAAGGGKVLLFPRMMHAKMVLVDDDFAFVGSANMDIRSLLYNYELGAFLYSKPQIRDAEAWLEGLFPQCETGYPRLTWAREIGEGVGRLFGPLL